MSKWTTFRESQFPQMAELTVRLDKLLTTCVEPVGHTRIPLPDGTEVIEGTLRIVPEPGSFGEHVMTCDACGAIRVRESAAFTTELLASDWDIEIPAALVEAVKTCGRFEQWLAELPRPSSIIDQNGGQEKDESNQ